MIFNGFSEFLKPQLTLLANPSSQAQRVILSEAKDLNLVNRCEFGLFAPPTPEGEFIRSGL